ncbi:hypothetical protein F5Y16DRAFT_159010 [Xylariaceae sp. FL0255]|nr:hypothetical protein F5Y16DRAFT_159010 [Xylariaceae sp. FL0255]
MSSESLSSDLPQESRRAGPFAFLDPTARYLQRTGAQRPSSGPKVSDSGHDDDDAAARRSDGAVSAPGVYQLWRSRDNRKGRHAIVVSPKSAAENNLSHPGHTDTLKETLRGIWKMVVRYPVWDVSYDVAVIFTIGSVIWVINGFFVLLPEVAPSSAFPGESTYGGGVTAFIGATIFEFGSILLMLEAVNEDRTDCFGWALEEAMESRSLLLRPDPDRCAHHHPVKEAFITKKGQPESSSKTRTWQWWPSWYELKTHYFRQIGFLACFSQMIGATVFWIAGFTGLPPIYNSLSLPAVNGIYWLPQVVGGTGFIISSWFFMLETQTKWYLPAPKTLGWHIGFWNLLGALGFTLCGALGFASANDSAVYGSLLATFIGSWAFLIGSAVQWFESLDKYPITIDKTVE